MTSKTALLRLQLPSFRWLAAWLLSALCTGLTASAATLYVWQDSPSPAAPYADWATAAHTIQDAVDAASMQDTVLVTNGVYATGGRAVDDTMTNRVVIDKPITVQSLMGPEVTTIVGAPAPGGTNGDGAIRCVYLGGIGAVLSGFTLTNGHTRARWPNDTGQQSQQEGGGVWCVDGLLVRCVLANNSASRDGGGVAGGTLYQCTLTGNTAEDDGGGADESVLYACTLIGNLAGDQGGGAQECTLYFCVLTNNEARHYGGGADDSELENCILQGNSAVYGGGANNTRLYHCALTGNSASQGGGGTWERIVLLHPDG